MNIKLFFVYLISLPGDVPSNFIKKRSSGVALLTPLLGGVGGLFLFLTVAIAQNQILIDSLEKKLPSSDGKEKIKLLSDLCWEYRYLSPAKAKIYGRHALGLSEKIKYPQGKAQAYNDLGVVYQYTGEYDTAVEYYGRSLAIREELNDSMGIAAVLNKIGMIHKERGELKEALEIFIRTISIYEQLKFDQGISHLLNNIAVIYQLQNNFTASLDYNFRSLAIKEKLNDDYGRCGSLINIGSIYRYQHHDSLASHYYEAGIQLARKINEPNYLAQALNNLGSLITDKGEYKKALTPLLEAYAIRKELDDKKGMSSSLINIGSVYRQLGDFTKAKTFLEEALKLSVELKARQEIQNAYLNLAQLFYDTGKMSKAYEYLFLYTREKDSLVNEEINRQIIDMQTKYETEKKEKQIAMQEISIQRQKAEIRERNLQMGLLAGILVFILVFAALLIGQQKLRQKQLADKAKIEQQELHLRSIIEGEETERQRLARELHDGLGQLLSSAKMNASGVSVSGNPENEHLLHNSLDLMDRACNDLREISHNLMPSALLKSGLIPALDELAEKISGGGKIQFHFSHFGLEARPDASMETALYRIIQELVNNTIRYARAANITLQVTGDDKEITVTLEDDGVGFDIASLEKSDGIGWRNIKSRVEFLKGSIHIDSRPEHGTTATIDIPV